MKIRTSAVDDVPPRLDYQAPRRAEGVLESRRLSPDDAPLWLCVSTLAAGGTIAWDDRHGDDGIYVLEGELGIDGERCPTGGAVIVESGRPASEVCRAFTPLPQLLKSLRVNGGAPLDDAGVKEAIRCAEASLGNRGRLLVRKSGTEPVIRVMAEGEDEALVGRVVDDLASAIAAADLRHAS